MYKIGKPHMWQFQFAKENFLPKDFCGNSNLLFLCVTPKLRLRILSYTSCHVKTVPKFQQINVCPPTGQSYYFPKSHPIRGRCTVSPNSRAGPYEDRVQLKARPKLVKWDSLASGKLPSCVTNWDESCCSLTQKWTSANNRRQSKTWSQRFYLTEFHSSFGWLLCLQLSVDNRKLCDDCHRFY